MFDPCREELRWLSYGIESALLAQPGSTYPLRGKVIALERKVILSDLILDEKEPRVQGQRGVIFRATVIKTKQKDINDVLN